MRTHGTLTQWNDERGFGFILPAQGTATIFVHVSAFPRDGVRPQVGEVLSFEIEAGRDGRQRAMRVSRPGERSRQTRHKPAIASRRARHQRSRLRDALVAVMLVGVVAIIGYTRWRTRPSDPAMPWGHETSAAIAPEPAFACDGRTHCSQMHSCAEATYFLKHCPGTKMDGNHDGVPCEQQWCGSD